MRSISNHLPIHFLIIFVFLAQTSSAMAAWHIDLPSEHDNEECVLIIVHQEAFHSDESVGNDHHHTCNLQLQNVGYFSSEPRLLTYQVSDTMMLTLPNVIYTNPSPKSPFRPPIV